MASIRANEKDGRVVSYRFTACLGRERSGKQIRKYTTWQVPPGMTPAKAKKAAERAADLWEQSLVSKYQDRMDAGSAGQACPLPAEKRHDDFISFINNVWFPLQIRDGKHKPKTVSFYESMIKFIIPYFKTAVLQELSPA